MNFMCDHRCLSNESDKGNLTGQQEPSPILHFYKKKISSILACLDRRVSSFCMSFQDVCHNKILGQGDVMRVQCPTTCHVPCSMY